MNEITKEIILNDSKISMHFLNLKYNQGCIFRFYLNTKIDPSWNHYGMVVSWGKDNNELQIKDKIKEQIERSNAIKTFLMLNNVKEADLLNLIQEQIKETNEKTTKSIRTR